MFGFFKGKDLKTVLNKTKAVKINGVNFVIRKIDPIDHVKGLDVMRSQFDVYKLSRGEIKMSDGQLKKIRKHYRDVFLSGVVSPNLSLSDSEDSVCVDEIFRDEEMSEKLYMEIMFLTYGKKKLMSTVYQELSQ